MRNGKQYPDEWPLELLACAFG